jgi:predicted O-methyltransferase YrrM
VLPPRVALFLLRARRSARRSGDDFSLVSASRPRELAELIRLGAGAKVIVELGTGTGWTAAALALAHPAASITTYDPIVRPPRTRYLALAGASERVRCVTAPAEAGPRAGERDVELLFIDSSHTRAETIAAFRAWRPALAAAAHVAFHDFDHPDYPGVAEAIAELGLRGTTRGSLFVWQAG